MSLQPAPQMTLRIDDLRRFMVGGLSTGRLSEVQRLSLFRGLPGFHRSFQGVPVLFHGENSERARGAIRLNERRRCPGSSVAKVLGVVTSEATRAAPPSERAGVPEPRRRVHAASLGKVSVTGGYCLSVREVRQATAGRHPVLPNATVRVEIGAGPQTKSVLPYRCLGHEVRFFPCCMAVMRSVASSAIMAVRAAASL